MDATDPYLQCSVLCDDVGRTGDGKLIIYGVFEAILSADFPATHRSCYVCNRWSGGSGTYKERVRVLSPDGLNTILEGPETAFSLANRSACHTVVCRLDGLTFEDPGVYWVQVLLDGRVVCEYALGVRPLPASAEGPGPARGGNARRKRSLIQH